MDLGFPNAQRDFKEPFPTVVVWILSFLYFVVCVAMMFWDCTVGAYIEADKQRKAERNIFN